MEYKDLLYFLENVGTDPSRLIFEDELTGIYNRRFLLNYFQYKVPWDSLDSHPVSLMMMDLDHFKQINDNHGHDVGDQALIYVAKLLEEMAGEEGLAIRYAGDEFMILFPQVEREAALEVGEQLVKRIHDEPLRLEEIDGEIPITLSIGLASAPDDAESGKALIQKADTALYYAKKSGRDRLAIAGQISAQDVFPKTAQYQLDHAKIVGRKTQLVNVTEALKKFSQRQSQFLIVEGADGMGKSEFLGTLRQNLAKSKISQIAVKGLPQELFRPYYLTTNILAELLNQRPDKGIGILDTLSPKEVIYLSYLLPQLLEPDEDPLQEDEETQRAELFSTLVHVIPKLLKSSPLIVFVDDLHCSDEATLLLLRQLLLRQDIPLFLCGTATEIQPDTAIDLQSPLERFFAVHQEELNINRIALTPLTPSDIATHFQGIFPQVHLPENFEENLAQLTQGNPLFVGEIQRKLVLDGKISLTGQQWVIEPLEEGYLPRSLEEIVSQKIAVMDEEGSQLLDHASTMGENVSLSVLTGSSENQEIKVQEFIDQAVTQGLISSEFQMNDDSLRFLSKRILDITYGTIQEDRKQELHERIGNYQEALYAQRLLPSVATLAYHFQLSANKEKARLYLEAQQELSNRIFNVDEAAHYTGDELPESGPEDVPLGPAELSLIPQFVRALLTTVRNIKLYPPGSQAIIGATEQLKKTIEKILVNNERLNIAHAEDILSVNGEEVDVAEFKSIAEALIKFLSRLQLRGIAFTRGLRENELTVMLEALGRISRKMIGRRFWRRFSAEQRLLNIELRQVRYASKAGEEGVQEHGRTAAELDATKVLVKAQVLDQMDLDLIPRLIRCLITAASNIKLYPPESKAISRSIQELQAALQDLLARRPAITLARVGEALLINGQNIVTSDFKTIADGLLKLLETIGLRSLTFLNKISTKELKTFISALGQTPVDGFDREHWYRLAVEEGLSSILFDQQLYELLKEQIGLGADAEEAVADEEPEVIEPAPDEGLAEPAAVEPEKKAPIETVEGDAVQLTESFLEKAAEKLSDLFLKGDNQESEQIIRQLFHGFPSQTPSIRTKVIHICGNLLKDLGVGSQPQLTDLLLDPLLRVLAEEQDSNLLKQMGESLSSTTANFLMYGDFQRASRVLTHLQKRQRRLHEGGDERAPEERIVFVQQLEKKTQEVLLADLRSQDPSRLQQAAKLLGSLGSVSMPVLLEVVKHEEDLRLRQIAAHLLSELGPEATKMLKRELILEGFAEERARILEIIDGVSADLKMELTYALGDESPEVRRAALRLAERLNDERVTAILLEYANHEDPSLAVVAIKSLGKLRPTGAVGVLVSLLDSAKEPARLIACCRALGKIADPASIEPLAKLLSPAGLLSFRKKRTSLVRATAAFALAQIPHPQVAEILAPYVEDRDPRVRQTAQDLVNRSVTAS